MVICMLELIDSVTVKRNAFLRDTGAHPTWALFVMEEGSFFLEINNVKTIIKAKDIVLFEKDVEFQRKVLTPVTFHFIKFNVLDESIFAGLAGKLEFVDSDRIKSTIRNIKYYINKFDDLSKIFLKHFINDIFYQSYIEKNLNNFSTLIYHTDPLVEEIIEYFKKNLDKETKISLVAQKYYLTHSGLIWKFKKSINMTPTEVLNNLRIMQAKKMLINSNMRIKEISQACGYENPYYFSNAFKKATNHSPLKYRELFSI